MSANKRVLLVAINSQYIHTNPALYALLRAAEGTGCADMVERLDFSINMPPQQILAEIYQKGPDILAFSVYIWNIAFLTPLLTDLRALLPETVILLGGPEATARATDYLHSLPIDGVCCGEGEESFASYLQALRQGSDGHGVAGYLWPGEEAAFVPAPKPDLAKLPFLYTEAEGQSLRDGKKVVYYEASRGCPFACSFCASAKERLRERPLSQVLEELPLLAAYGGQIKFIDRTFNANIERACAITERILALRHKGLSWHFEISPFHLAKPLTELWLSAPRDYIQLEMGVQTLNPAALAAVGRRGSWEEAEPLIKSLIDSGKIHLHLDLIAGLPLDSKEGFAASFHRLHQLNADYLQFGFLKVLPGSLLAEQADHYGLVYSQHPPYRILSTPTMDAGCLFTLQQAEHAFQVLYNRGTDYRATLIERAQHYPSGALAMYEQAASLLTSGSPSREEKGAVVAAL